MVEGNGNLATIQPTAKAQRTQRKKGHITFSLLQISRYARHFLFILVRTKHICRVDPEFGHLDGVRRDRDKMLRDGTLIASEPPHGPIPSRAGIGHRLQGREGLGGDDEEGFCRIEVARRFREICPIDIGDEPERDGPVAIMFERLICHHRPQVRAADTDVDDVADASPRVARPRTAAHAFRKRGC